MVAPTGSGIKSARLRMRSSAGGRDVLERGAQAVDQDVDLLWRDDE
jgi:hypothetical protein